MCWWRLRVRLDEGKRTQRIKTQRINEHQYARAALISVGVLRFEAAGTGPVVVLAPGNFVDARMSDPQFEHFAEVFTAVRYDLRGFGASPAADVPYSHHGDLRELLAHARMPRTSSGSPSITTRSARFPAPIVPISSARPSRLAALAVAA